MSDNQTNFDIEKTLILLKPDTVSRGLIGEVISRFEKKSFKVVWLKLIQLTEEVCVEHYGHHSTKPYFPKIVSYMTDGPVVGIILEGIDVVRQIRNLCGETDPQFAAAGTIRWDYSCTIDSNLIHASDSVETANVEIERFFDEDELVSYTKSSYVC